MGEMFAEWHDITRLGFPGWEAARALKVEWMDRIPGGLVGAARPTGGKLELIYEARSGAELFDEMCRTINNANHWASPEYKARLRNEYEEFQREIAAKRVMEIKPMDPNALRHSWRHIADRYVEDEQ